MKEYIDLFWTFLKIGAVSFGGGYAMVPVLERELIKGKGWVTMEEVMDYYTIAQVTPGIVAINVSTFIGNKRKGFLGGIISTIGFIIPGITLITIISFFISRFAENKIVHHAFAGIRVAVGALILNTVFRIFKGFYKELKSTALFIIAFAVSAFFKQSPVYTVLGAGILGWLLYSPKKPKEQSDGKE